MSGYQRKSRSLIEDCRGASPHWVAKLGLLKPRDPDTLYSWLQIYLDEGFEGLIRRQHGGARRGLCQKKAELITCLRQSSEAWDAGKTGVAGMVGSAPSRLWRSSLYCVAIFLPRSGFLQRSELVVAQV